MPKTNSVTDYFGVIEPFGPFFLTKTGSLIGAIELAGRDPDGLERQDHFGLSLIAGAIYGRLHRNIGIYQYFSHCLGAKASIRRRDHAVDEMLGRRREQHLNQQALSQSHLVHYFEFEPDENLNKLGVPNAVIHVMRSVFDRRSRAIVKNQFSTSTAFVVETARLNLMAAQLQDVITEVTLKWQGLFYARQLNAQEQWAHMRFLASFQAQALNVGMHEAIPGENLDLFVPQGDIDHVQLSGMDVLKIVGPTNQYARFAAIRGLTQPGGRIKPALWVADKTTPARRPGNYVLMTHWKPFSEFERSMMFSKMNLALDRSNINIFDMLQGGDNKSILEKQATMKPAVKDKIEELGIAEGSTDTFGTGHGMAVVFDESAVSLRAAVLEMNRALTSSGINVTWESVGLDNAFQALQPGNHHLTERKMIITGAQHGALAMLYQSSIGQPIVKDLGTPETNFEEAQYIFTSTDNKLYHYSPFVNGRAFVICVGPIRSGKTYLKNTLATHFMKYGGIYRAIDIDPGTEPIALTFGDRAGIFRVGGQGTQGFNIFSSLRGVDDNPWRVHINAVLHEFLQANDTEELRRISAAEQSQIDAAVEASIRLDASKTHLRTLSGLVAHMPRELQAKFARWVRKTDATRSGHEGRYAALFDNEIDAIGDLRTPFGVFNLQALRDDPKALRPVWMETFYRLTQTVEDPRYRDTIKVIDMDEAHNGLKIPYVRGYIESKVRTWGKWYASINLWSQTPKEYSDVENWAALRSAATTFLFMADPKMEEGDYLHAFPFLTRGELDAIRNLTPQRHAYIVQPDIGVSKVIVLDTEPEQYVINTSHPREAAMRDALIKAHGFEAGIAIAIEKIQAMRAHEKDIKAQEQSPFLKAVNN